MKHPFSLIISNKLVGFYKSVDDAAERANFFLGHEPIGTTAKIYDSSSAEPIKTIVRG